MRRPRSPDYATPAVLTHARAFASAGRPTIARCAIEAPRFSKTVSNDASLRGVIAGQIELSHAPAAAWTFEQLSAEPLDRLQLSRARTVLDDSPLF